MKKPIAILLMLLYSTIAFSNAVDCGFCNGKMALSTQASKQNQCDCSASQMKVDCCGTATIACATDNSQKQVTSSFLSVSFTDYLITPLQAEDVFLNRVSEESSANDFTFTHPQSSRQLLAFIHILRI